MDDEIPGHHEQAQPSSGASYKANLEASYADPALETIKAAVKGNGIKTEHVKLEKFEGETLEFIATTALELKNKVTNKTSAGKVTGPKRVDNPQDLRSEIEKENHKITHDQTAIKNIKTMLLERKDKGFGLDQETIKLKSLKSEYVYYEACPPCASHGKIKCQRCHGKGYEQCTRCHGDGYESCHHCNGARQVQEQGGQYQPCPKCHGHGKTSCTLCQQTKRVQCSVCKTVGSTTCKQCGGQGWNSHISVLEHEALCHFDYDRSAVPEKIQNIITQKQGDLHEHLAFEAILHDGQPTPNQITQAYKVVLPYADIELTLGEISVPAFIFGPEGALVNTPDFLNEVLKKPIKLLNDAVSGQSDINANVKNALRYKTIRSAFKAVIKFREAKAAKALFRSTPVGLSAETAMQLTKNANIVLNQLTRKQIQTNRAITGAGGALLLAVYYFGARTTITNHIGNSGLSLIVDAVILGAIIAAGYLITKQFSEKIRLKLIKSLLPSK